MCSQSPRATIAHVTPATFSRLRAWAQTRRTQGVRPPLVLVREAPWQAAAMRHIRIWP